MGRRKSKQRERIFNLIRSSGIHPTAQWLLPLLKKEFPAINEANLYRNIRILIEEGNIASRDIGDGLEHYDAVITNHYHFVCKQCGSIIDIDIPIEDHVAKEFQQLMHHKIENHTIQFFGVCTACLKKPEKIVE